MGVQLEILEKLTKDLILHGQLPLKELLDNSLYYPSCEFDGGVVKYYSKEIQSFIYCDYATGEEALMRELDSFRGYHLLGNRSLSMEELVPSGWQVILPPTRDLRRYFRAINHFKKPFAHWAVYERAEDFGEDHGPKRFSLIYVGGEGVATYQALYWSNKKTPKALAIIQPGTGFGNNWTDFRSRNGALAWVVFNNTFGTPDTIFYGGYNKDYDNLNWPEYEYVSKIKPYYHHNTGSYFGEVTIWSKL